MSFFEQMGNVWRVRPLRRKMLITLGLLAICRIGVYIPLPDINVEVLGNLFKQVEGEGVGRLLGLADMFTGGALRRGAIFGLGIMPYISASIIFTLLANVVPALEQLRKEGAAGQKKINQYTRIATVFLCLFQGALITRTLLLSGDIITEAARVTAFARFRFMVGSGFILMAGTMFLMWIGEQIDAHGIGNGISMVITIGILARLPSALRGLITDLANQESQQVMILTAAVLIALFIGVVVVVVYITRGERRIPVQQQKHVRGPRVYGGQKHYLPLRVNQAGVMPIIFGSALLMFPSIIANVAIKSVKAESFWYGFFTWINDAVSPSSGGLTFTYVFLYGVLIFFFCYFWTAIMFNPKDMSENLQSYGSFIPGIRPGKRTANYLEGVMNRVTLAGSFFLVVVALMPMMVASAMNVGGGMAAFYGGTSILIVVGVTLDLVRRINDHLEMRRYSGFGAGAGGRRRRRRR